MGHHQQTVFDAILMSFNHGGVRGQLRVQHGVNGGRAGRFVDAQGGAIRRRHLDHVVVPFLAKGEGGDVGRVGRVGCGYDGCRGCHIAGRIGRVGVVGCYAASQGHRQCRQCGHGIDVDVKLHGQCQPGCLH